MINNVDDILRKAVEDVFGADNVMYKGKNSICSTCKHFNGKTCAKGKSFAGFANKLSDCNDEWEVCNG